MLNHDDHRLVPNNGTASDVAGIVSATIFRKTVKESKIVTPRNQEFTLIDQVLTTNCVLQTGRKLMAIKLRHGKVKNILKSLGDSSSRWIMDSAT